MNSILLDRSIVQTARGMQCDPHRLVFTPAHLGWLDAPQRANIKNNHRLLNVSVLGSCRERLILAQGVDTESKCVVTH